MPDTPGVVDERGACELQADSSLSTGFCIAGEGSPASPIKYTRKIRNAPVKLGLPALMLLLARYDLPFLAPKRA